MDRQLLGYLVLGTLALALAGMVAFTLYNSRVQIARRRVKMEKAAHTRANSKRGD